jgi:hypothetical protein
MLLFSLLVAGVSAWEQKIEGSVYIQSLSDDGNIGVYHKDDSDRGAEELFTLYDKSGKKLWDYSIPTTMEAVCFSSSDNGNYHIMGYKSKNDGSSFADYYFIYLNKDGKEQWQKTYEKESATIGAVYASEIANDGSFYVIRDEIRSSAHEEERRVIDRYNAKGELIYTYSDTQREPLRFSVTNDGNTIVILAGDNVKYLNTITGSEWTYDAPYAICVDVTGDGTYVAVGIASTTSSIKSGLIILDSSGKKICSAPTGSGHWVLTVGITDSGEYTVISDHNEQIRCFDKSGKELWSRSGKSFELAENRPAVMIIDSTNPDKFALYSIENVKIMEGMTQYDVARVAITKNGEYLAAGCKDYLYYYNPSYPTAGLSFSGIESDGSTGNTAQSAPLGLLSVIMSLAIICVLIRNRDDR